MTKIFPGVLEGLGGWKTYNRDLHNELEMFPNRIHINKDRKQAACVSARSRNPGGDFSLSKNALLHVVRAKNAGIVDDAFVVLRERSSNIIVCVQDAEEVFDRLRRFKCSIGENRTQYWWVNEDLCSTQINTVNEPLI